MNRKELQALSRIRLREAQALVNLGMNDGAYYLAGYSVECALKACIAKMTQRHDFPDKRKADSSYTHVLRELVTAAKLEKAHSEEAKARCWTFATTGILYNRGQNAVAMSLSDSEAAKQLIEAVANRKHGVLRWVKRHW